MKTALLAAFLAILTIPAFAQQPGEPGQKSGTPPCPAQSPAPQTPDAAKPAVSPAAPGSPAPAEAKPAPTAAAPAGAKPAPTADSLVTDSLGQDIATGSYYELVAGCQ
jgi:hypothetical protein